MPSFIINGLKICIFAALVATANPGLTGERPASQLFQSATTSSSGDPSPVGSYAQGCVAGAVELPETGATWQAMRLSRNRNWGHPVLIDYIIGLSGKAAEYGWKGLFVGDMSQPRGGPMPTGHSSHQIGLDVDIWLLPPDRLDLTRDERETISSISVRTADQTRINENWTDSHMRVLKAAAEDPRVDRIFLNAAAKISMCDKATGDGAWLQKIRPWHQHNYHFHVRLKCPPGAAYCMPQRPTVAELTGGGNGCDKSLEWWVTDYLDRPTAQPADDARPSSIRSAPSFLMSDLPEACSRILAAE